MTAASARSDSSTADETPRGADPVAQSRPVSPPYQRCPNEPADPFNDPGCSTPGIPVVAEAGIGNSVVGIAIHLFGNLNTLAPFGGVGVSLPLGWMR